MNRIKKAIIPVVGKIGRPVFYSLGLIMGKDKAQAFRLKVQKAVSGTNPKFRNNKKDVKRLEEKARQGKELNLYFGCGPRILKKWINIDISYEPNWAKYYKEEIYPSPDRGSRDDFYKINICEGPLPLPDNSVTTVFHEDFIEHITQEQAVLFLAETYRVLKPGGIHRINTPDLISSMKRHSDFKKGWNGVYIAEWRRHGHLNIFTRDYLSQVARLVGYSKVEFNTRDKSLSNRIPKEIRPGNDKTENEQIFCDLIK